MKQENSVQKKIILEPIKDTEDNYKKLTHCPYCQAKLVKRGKRKKKYEKLPELKEHHLERFSTGSGKIKGSEQNMKQ